MRFLLVKKNQIIFFHSFRLMAAQLLLLSRRVRLELTRATQATAPSSLSASMDAKRARSVQMDLNGIKRRSIVTGHSM